MPGKLEISITVRTLHCAFCGWTISAFHQNDKSWTHVVILQGSPPLQDKTRLIHRLAKGENEFKETRHDW